METSRITGRPAEQIDSHFYVAHPIRDGVESEPGITLRRSDESHSGNEWLYKTDGASDERRAAELEQTLVASHA
jgi:hypothetical protein